MKRKHLKDSVKKDLLPEKVTMPPPPFGKEELNVKRKLSVTARRQTALVGRNKTVPDRRKLLNESKKKRG